MRGEVKRAFNPEFLNRLDDMILFTSLNDDDLIKIIGLLVERINKNLGSKQIKIQLNEDAAKYILEKTCADRSYGARPLRRALQKYIEDPLSEALIQGILPRPSELEIYLGELGIYYRNLTPAAEAVRWEPVSLNPNPCRGRRFTRFQGPTESWTSRTSTLPLLTFDALEGAPDDGNRYEIIDGELYVSSAPSFLHQSVLTNIFTAFIKYLEGNRIGKIVPGVGVIFDQHNGAVPDLVFLTKKRQHKILQAGQANGGSGDRDQILSPGSSNQKRDREIKLNLYSAREVSEYWIVDPENRSVELYRRVAQALELAGNLMSADRIESPALRGFSVPVEDFFAE